MKRYIEAKTSLKQGSYVVDREGNIHDIGMHVPSTTYLTRGLIHLATTDAEFLLNQGLINEDEAKSIMLYCYEEFLEDECGYTDLDMTIPLTKLSEFVNYAEMKWAKTCRSIFFNMMIRSLGEIEDVRSELPDFDNLNRKWYPYLKDNYCKISRFGDVVEFRISSDDFNWNKVIIDKVILKYDSGKPYTTRYYILKESDKGYQSYFENATLEDILENDKVVLSSEYLERKIINSEVKYMKKRIIGSQYRESMEKLEDWCKTLSERIHTLYLHYADGRIIGKFLIQNAIDTYGEAHVTNSYYEGDGLMSVWLIE